jgi:hypothetical protein
MLGLLTGALYECPETKADYMIVDSVADRAWALPRPGQGLDALKEAASAERERGSHRILGWYFAAEAPGRLGADAEALHRAVCDQPWQVALALGSRADGVWGSFFRRDLGNGSAYPIPFRELILASAELDRGVKPTAIAWPTYLTGDATVPMAPTAAPLPELRNTVRAAAAPLPEAATATPAAPERPRRGFASVLRGVVDSAPEADLSPDTTASVPASHVRAKHTPAAQTTAPPAPPPRTVPPAPQDRPVALASVPRANAASDAGRGAGTGRDARRRGTADASGGDEPDGFVATARDDGFYLIAKFAETGEVPDKSARESLWVLHDPYCGLLLLVNTRGSEVLDASLHYNLRVDDAAVLAATFSEHRNLDAGVVYKRESCSDSLRARCRQLRDTQALVREWKVKPSIYLVTLGEWESLAGVDPIGGARGIQQLNQQRVATLPESIVSRYGFAGPEAVGDGGGRERRGAPGGA